VLAEFASVVDAVRGAVEVQQELQALNAALPEHRRMEFRIGINLGDIIEEEGRLYGDGVNIAARVEGLAEPGGICVSGNAHEQVRNKLPLGFEYAGEHEVKNVAEPVRIYRVVLEPRAAPVRTAEPEGGELPLPECPSIAVLPFVNMSGDPEQEYFSDGMTEDLITDLSKISGLFVIARNSTFIYKDQAADVRQIARELGVRYVLEGSVRRAGERVRINAQLIDAISGGHVWAERYDDRIDDIFDLQDRITRHIIAALALRLTAAETASVERRETASVAAHDAFLRGWEHFRRLSPEDFARAKAHLEEAIKLDPGYGRAHGALALTYWWASQFGSKWTQALGAQWQVARVRARVCLEAALEHPTTLAHHVASRLAVLRRRYDEALAAAERALALEPNDVVSQEIMALALLYCGRAHEALGFAQRAARLDPRNLAWSQNYLGMIHFALGRLDEAAAYCERAVAHAHTDARALYCPLAIAYAHLGRSTEARDALETYLAGFDFRPPPKLDHVLLSVPGHDAGRTLGPRSDRGRAPGRAVGLPQGVARESPSGRRDPGARGGKDVARAGGGSGVVAGDRTEWGSDLPAQFRRPRHRARLDRG
jgi:TolB-like protein